MICYKVIAVMELFKNHIYILDFESKMAMFETETSERDKSSVCEDLDFNLNIDDFSDS